MSKARGKIEFDVEGEAHALALTTNAMCKYQDRAGETLLEGFAALEKSSGDILRIRRMFWAGLATDASEDDAGNLIDVIGLERAAELLGEAAREAFPQQEDKAAGKSKAAKPPK